MSGITVPIFGPSSEIGALWEEARISYEKLSNHSLQSSISGNAATIDTILDEIGKKNDAFSQMRNDGSKLDRSRRALSRCLPLIQSLSSIIAHASKAAFPPSEAIFTAIRHLIITANNVTGDYNRLSEFFEDVSSYLEGLQIWDTNVPLIPELELAITEVLGSILTLCGLYTKYVKSKRLMKTFKALVSGEDAQLKDAHQRFLRIIEREGQVIKRATLSGVEQLKIDTSSTSAGIKKAVASTQRLENDVTLARQDVELLTNNLTRVEKSKILSWFSTLNVSTVQQNTFAKHHPGTGQWLFNSNEFQSWYFSDSTSTLWCPGDPGTGKSVMMSVAINYLEEHASASATAIAFMYCSYRDSQTHLVSEILSSIIRQLVEQCDTVPSEVEAFRDRFASRRSMRPTEKDRVSLIVALSQRFAKTFVFIDALDECPEEARDRLLRTMKSLELSVRLFITSRFSVELQGRLSNLVRLPIVSDTEDIRAYLESTLDEGGTRISSALAKYSNLRESIIQGVLKQANGMFLLAHLQVLYVCSQRNLAGIRRALCSLSKDVEEFYDASIERLQKQGPSDSDTALKAVAYVFCARRQLLLDELLHALAVEEGDKDLDRDAIDEKEIFQSLLHGLLRIDDSTNAVSLVHHTLYEYLQAHSQQLPSDYEKVLAKTCLTYLSFETFTIGACDTMGTMVRRLRDYRFLEYASRCWAFHAAEHLNTLTDLILPFIINEGKLAASVQIAYLPRRRVGNWHEQYPKQFTVFHAIAYWGLGTVTDVLCCNAMSISLIDSQGMTPLHLAAQFGHMAVIKRLLGLGAEVDAPNFQNETALILAARNGHFTVVALLLQHGALQLAEDAQGWTALEWAIIGTHINTVKVLLHSGARLQSDSIRLNKGLILAAETGNAEMVATLLHEGADVNCRDDQGSTPLDWAVPEGHVEVTQALLNHHANPNSKDNYGHQPLHWAIANSILTRLLIEFGANVDCKTNKGQSPLLWSVLAGQAEVTRTLLDLGASVDARNTYGFTALHAAAFKGDVEITRLLLDNKADPDITDEDGWTPLQVAAVNERYGILEILTNVTSNSHDLARRIANSLKHKDVLALGQEMAARKSVGSAVVCGLRMAINSGYKLRLLALLETGADIDAVDDIGGATALTHAAWLGEENIVELLLDHGADIDVRDASGHTALHWAAEGGYSDMVSLLLNKGATVDLTVFGWTAMLIAARRWEQPCIVKILVERGANVNAQDFHGRSVLHWSCRHGCKDTTKFILCAGGDVDARDHYGQTALHWAVASAKPAIVRVLLKHNASANLSARDGTTALHIAAYIGNLEVATVILNDKKRRQRRRAGTGADIGVADLAAINTDGLTATRVAELTNNHHIAQLLRQAEGECGDSTATLVTYGANDKRVRAETGDSRPTLRLSYDDEFDYLKYGDGMDSLGIPLFQNSMHSWLSERSKHQLKQS